MRTVSLGGIDLDQRRHYRHHDLGGDAVALRVKGHALSVISGAGCYDATLFLVCAQRQNLIEGSALFERTGPLQVFEL